MIFTGTSLNFKNSQTSEIRRRYHIAHA